MEQGSLYFKAGSHARPLHAGFSALIAPRVLHGAQSLGDCRFTAIVFKKDFVHAQCEDKAEELLHILFTTASAEGALYAAQGEARDIESLCASVRTAYYQKKSGFSLSVKADLLKMLYLFYRSGKAPSESGSDDEDGRLARALALIHEGYRAPLSVRDMAEAACASQSHFERLFRRVMGMTPIAYLIQWRIARAAELVAKGEESISDIALGVGFNDFSYFSRIFKEYMGLSPRAYRKKKRAESEGLRNAHALENEVIPPEA